MSAGADDPQNRRLAAAAQRLATEAPGYLERVRQAAGRLTAPDVNSTDGRAALAAIEELAVIDLEVPTVSRIPAARYVKRAVKSLIAWYLRYFGRQLSAFGQAMTHFGGILLDRTERVEGVAADLQSDVASLSGRVASLEERLDQIDAGKRRAR
jgi:hypothetical protein